jgi:CTP synthase (UTP-ammonia lyase)
MPLSAKEKVSMFCQVDKDHVNKQRLFCFCLSLFNLLIKVICIPDVKTLYRVPLLLEENGVFNFLSTRLHLVQKVDYDRSLMIKWRDLTER